MNFVELVNDLIVESAVSGRPVASLQGDLPAEIGRLKMWTRDVWNELQLKPQYWGFHFVSASMTVPLNASVLQPPEFLAGEVAEWDLESFRISEPLKARKDSERLLYRDYFYFRDHDGLDTTVSRKPQTFTIDWRSESIIIAPPSDAVRTLFYDYWRVPQQLKLDADVPIMPARYHKALVGLALERYALHESAPEALTKARRIIGEYMTPLHQDQGVTPTTRGLMDCY